MDGCDCIKCNACKGSRLKVKYEMGTWQVLCCTQCGFVFAYPLKGKDCNKPVHDPYTVITHRDYRDSLQGAAQNRVPVLSRHLDALSGLRVLDVGCGNGYFLHSCKQIGMDVAGVEINQAAAEYAKKQFSISVVATQPPYTRFFEESSLDVTSGAFPQAL